MKLNPIDWAIDWSGEVAQQLIRKDGRVTTEQRKELVDRKEKDPMRWYRISNKDQRTVIGQGDHLKSWEEAQKYIASHQTRQKEISKPGYISDRTAVYKFSLAMARTAILSAGVASAGGFGFLSGPALIAISATEKELAYSRIRPQDKDYLKVIQRACSKNDNIKLVEDLVDGFGAIKDVVFYRTFAELKDGKWKEWGNIKKFFTKKISDEELLNLNQKYTRKNHTFGFANRIGIYGKFLGTIAVALATLYASGKLDLSSTGKMTLPDFEKKDFFEKIGIISQHSTGEFFTEIAKGHEDLGKAVAIATAAVTNDPEVAQFGYGMVALSAAHFTLKSVDTTVGFVSPAIQAVSPLKEEVDSGLADLENMCEVQDVYERYRLASKAIKDGSIDAKGFNEYVKNAKFFDCFNYPDVEIAEEDRQKRQRLLDHLHLDENNKFVTLRKIDWSMTDWLHKIKHSLQVGTLEAVGNSIVGVKKILNMPKMMYRNLLESMDHYGDHCDIALQEKEALREKHIAEYKKLQDTWALNVASELRKEGSVAVSIGEYSTKPTGLFVKVKRDLIETKQAAVDLVRDRYIDPAFVSMKITEEQIKAGADATARFASVALMAGALAVGISNLSPEETARIQEQQQKEDALAIVRPALPDAEQDLAYGLLPEVSIQSLIINRGEDIKSKNKDISLS